MLIPELTREATHPTGYNPNDLNAMLVGGEQGAGGAAGGLAGETGLRAARSRNTGALSGVLGEISRNKGRQLSENALNVQGMNAQEKERQRQAGLSGLEGVRGGDIKANLEAQGLVPAYDIAVGTTAQPRVPERRTSEAEAPEIGRLAPVGGEGVPASSSPRLRSLGYQERQRLPMVSAAVPAGSAEFERNKVARIEDQKAHPWGSEENHPGRLGKIAHVLSRIGNIAGDVIDPAAMAIIPGTDLHRNVEEAGAEKRLSAAETRESEVAERKAQTENLESEAEARKNPKPKLLSGEENVRTDQGGNRERAYELPDTSIQWKPEGAEPNRLQPIGGQNATPQYVYGKPKPGTDEEQFVGKYLKDNKLPDTAENRLAGATEYKNGAPIGDTDAKQLTTQIGNALKDTGISPAGYAVTAKSTRGEANEALKAAQAAANEHRATVAPENAQSRKDARTMGYAIDEKGELKYMSKSDADKIHSTFEEVKSGDVNKDRQAIRQLNDVQMNTSRYRKAIDSLKESLSPLAVTNMSAILSDKGFGVKLEPFGVGLDVGMANDAIKGTAVASAWNSLKPAERNVLIGYLRAKSSVIAYQKALTGVGRTNKEQLEIEMNNLPLPYVGATVAGPQMNAWQENVDRATEGFPTNLPGIKSPKQVRGEAEGAGTEDKPPKEADPGMKWQHRTANGKTEWRQVKAQQ